jgi:hypothetical protein
MEVPHCSKMSVPVCQATWKNIPEDSNILLQSTIDYSKSESWISVLHVHKVKNIPFWTNIRLVYCIFIFKLIFSFIFIPGLFLEEKNPNQLCQSMIKIHHDHYHESQKLGCDSTVDIYMIYCFDIHCNIILLHALQTSKWLLFV